MLRLRSASILSLSNGLIFVFCIAGICLAQSGISEVRPAYVSDLNVTIDVAEDASVKVKELINWQSSGLSNMSWNIPGQANQIEIKQNGSVVSPDQYKIIKSGNQLLIQGIISGQFYYANLEINYRLDRGLKEGRSTDSLDYFLEPKGSMINRAKITVHLPKALDKSDLDPQFYAIHGISSSEGRVLDGKTFEYSAANLGPYSKFTIEPTWPKGIIAYPPLTWLSNFILSLGRSFWVISAILLPLITFFLLFLLFIFRRIHYRIPTFPSEIRTPPDNISPAALGALYSENIGPREIAATIIDLASRGYLFIINKEDKGFVFGKRREVVNLAPFEKALTQEFFKGGISAGIKQIAEEPQKEIYSETITKIYNYVYDDIARLGYFIHNPRLVHLRYKVSGIILFLLGSIALFTSGAVLPYPPFLIFVFLGVVLASLVIIAMSRSLSVRSPSGRESLGKWLAFREYLVNYKSKVGYNEIVQETFVKYLPYAIVLKCEQEWAAHFTDAPFKQPDWYAAERSFATLPEFANDLYPMIDYIAQIFESLKEANIK